MNIVFKYRENSFNKTKGLKVNKSGFTTIL